MYNYIKIPPANVVTKMNKFSNTFTLSQFRRSRRRKSKATKQPEHRVLVR